MGQFTHVVVVDYLTKTHQIEYDLYYKEFCFPTYNAFSLVNSAYLLI